MYGPLSLVIRAMVHALAIPIGSGIVNVLGWIGLAAIPVSVLGFILVGMVLAVGEAGNFPAAIKATAEYFPKKERSFATGLFNSGANIGAVLAPLSVPWIESNLGMASGIYHHWCHRIYVVNILVYLL